MSHRKVIVDGPNEPPYIYLYIRLVPDPGNQENA